MLLPVVLEAGFVCRINPISVCFALDPSSNGFVCVWFFVCVCVQKKRIAVAEKGTVFGHRTAKLQLNSIRRQPSRGQIKPHGASLFLLKVFRGQQKKVNKRLLILTK